MIFSEANTQRIRDGDVVLCFNFRADRARELCQAFLRSEFDGFDRGAVPKVQFVTLTVYDETFPCEAIFAPQTLDMTLGETVAAVGMKQMRIAETEKYPHVTYFFNGGVEVENPGERRFIIPSPKDVATYDLKPQMSADEVTQTVVDNLKDFDLVILNFANPDMVGHTGVVEAAIKAVEKLMPQSKPSSSKRFALVENFSSPPITAIANTCAILTVRRTPRIPQTPSRSSTSPMTPLPKNA